MVNVFRSVQYDDPGLTDFFGTKHWRQSLSTLARIYESRDFLDLTGFMMDDKGVVRRTISDKNLKIIASIIIQGIKDNEFNTRTLGTIKSPRFTRLMSELREAIGSEAGESEPSSPPPSSGSAPSGSGTTAGSGHAPSGQGGGQPSSQPGSPGQSAKPPAPKKNKVRFLPVAHLVMPDQYPVALKLHLEELSTLDIQKFPIATFLMLRALVEKTIKAYAETKGIDIKGSGVSNTGYVQLFHALKWFEQYLGNNGPKSLIQPVMRLRTGTLVNYTSSHDALNAINHNHKFHVDPDEVVNCWNSIDAIMRELVAP